MNTPIKIEFKNDLQREIADLLWYAQDMSDVWVILNTFGADAQVAYDMILAAAFDQINDTDIAGPLLERIFKE